MTSILPPRSADVDAPAQPTPARRSIFERFEWLLVFLGFSVLGLAITWPLGIHMTSGLWGVANDNLGGAWAIEWYHKAFWGSETTTFTDQLQAPFGLELDQRYAQPMDKLFAILFGGIGNGLFANNLAVFLSFPLSGLTMYALAKYLTRSRPAAALAGVIFMSSPIHLAMAMNYNALASIQWCPLVVLTMLMALRERRKRDAAFAGASLALVWYTSYYYGWFALFIIAVMLVVAGLAGSWKGFRAGQLGRTLVDGAKFTVTRMGIAGATFAVLAIPVLFTMIGNVSENPGEYERIFDDLYLSSTHPWQFFLPPHDNPVFGRFTSEFVISHLGIVPVYEQSLYMGACAVLLALVAILFSRRSARRSVGVLLVTMVFAMFLSMGPFLPTHPFSVDAWMRTRDLDHFNNITYYAYQLSSAFRYYGRAWVWGSVCLAALAAIGFVVLEHRVRRFGAVAPVILATLLSAVVLTEYSNRGTAEWIDLSADQVEWVQEVEQLPEDATIIQYPIAGWSTPRSFWYQYYQAVHERATVNPPEVIEAGEFVAKAGVPDDPLTGETLHDAGIDYAVVHTKLPPVTRPPYQPKLPDDSMPAKTGALNPWFDLHSRTDDAVIYKVRDTPRPYTPTSLAAYLENFHSAEIDAEGAEQRWIRKEEATLLVLAGGTETKTHYLSFDALSFHEPRTLGVSVDDVAVGTPITVSNTAPTPVRLPLRLTPGRHVVKLVPSPGIAVVSSVIGGSDQRSISVQISKPSISDKAPTKPLLTFATGFGAEEADDAGPFRWIAADEGTLVLTAAAPGQRVVLKFSLATYLRPRTVRIMRANTVVREVQVPATGLAEVVLPLTLTDGQNELRLTTTPGAQQVEGPDERNLSVSVSRYAVTAAPARR